MALPGHIGGCAFDGANGSPPCTCGGLRDVDAEVAALARLLAHLRKEGYRVGPIKLGSLQLTIEDLRIDDHEGLKPDQHQPVNIWAAAGLDGNPNDSDGTIG
jgi:hypothetical protein